MSHRPGNEGSPKEAAVPASGVDETAEPVLPVFGLDLPRLPSPERTRDEQEFMSQGLESFPRRDPSWAEIGEKARSVLELFSDRRTFEEAPLDAVRLLGLAALRPGRFEDLPLWQPQLGSDSLMDRILRDLYMVRGLVWAGVARWQQKAKWDVSHEARRGALERLRKFGRALVPDTRGRRKEIGPPPEILLLAYRQLQFRLALARRLLDDGRGKRRVPYPRIQQVAEECGLNEDWIREWLFFSDRWERKPRTLTIEEMARELLHRISGMEPGSIETSISRGRRDDGGGTGES
ncbi:MAG: hypothetical protein P8R42_13180 [Candidatus Binatia bacterium]|nr:hypothetical protein [Candidatus Binatia bacterium]